MPTSTVENYLKSIFRLDQDTDRELTVGGIAEDLGVTPGTVSSMMRHLSDEGLIAYVPRKSVTLLREGRQQALSVVRRHRLIESFLVEIMKLDWSEVHEEAEILEHVVSDRLLQRMDEMLGHPSHDPHGDLIPDALGNVADQDVRSLSEVESGRIRIVRVGDSDPRFLDWLRESQMLPGCELEISGRDLVAGIIEMRILPDGREIRMGERAAANIDVEAI
jgi:DtxR family Mn-dependent transcriptional regulator